MNRAECQLYVFKSYEDMDTNIYRQETYSVPNTMLSLLTYKKITFMHLYFVPSVAATIMTHMFHICRFIKCFCPQVKIQEIIKSQQSYEIITEADPLQPQTSSLSVKCPGSKGSSPQRSPMPRRVRVVLSALLFFV